MFAPGVSSVVVLLHLVACAALLTDFALLLKRRVLEPARRRQRSVSPSVKKFAKEPPFAKKFAKEPLASSGD
jgi:hypothetical protein